VNFMQIIIYVLWWLLYIILDWLPFAFEQVHCPPPPPGVHWL